MLHATQLIGHTARLLYYIFVQPSFGHMSRGNDVDVLAGVPSHMLMKLLSTSQGCKM